MQIRSRSLEQWAALARVSFYRQWERALRLREKIRFHEETFHLAVAGVVGVIGGLTNVLFFGAISLITKVTMGHTGDLLEIAHGIPPWQRLLIPALGGLGAGLVLHWGLRLIGSQGSTNMVEVVIAGDGRLKLRTALVKAASSLLSICTGASIGREGLIAQTTATLASKLGQAANWAPHRLRLLVACGAASGLAAAYNAPVAGAVFAAHIVLGNFSMHYFAPLVCSSVVATMLSRSFFGIKPWYVVPPYDFTRFGQLPWFILLGALSGLLAAAFLKLLRYTEERFTMSRLPTYGKVALGGLITGLLAVPCPEVWGNGYGAINEILQLRLTLSFLVAVFLAKLLATSATVGSGTAGGVLTPTLFLGASLGGIFGTLLRSAGWSALPNGAFALVGMGAVLSATIHAPLLAMILIFEISLNYSIMPPLMLACAVSTLVARRLHRESIYTEPLRLKGLSDLSESREIGAATRKTVGELTRAPVPPLNEATPLSAIADRFLTCANNFLPVVDASQRLVGMVALQDLKEYLNPEHEMNAIIASDVMRPPPECLTPNQRLLDVLPIILRSELRNIPVVSSPIEFRLVGAVLKSEALEFLHEAIAAPN